MSHENNPMMDPAEEIDGLLDQVCDLSGRNARQHRDLVALAGIAVWAEEVARLRMQTASIPEWERLRGLRRQARKLAMRYLPGAEYDRLREQVTA